jgi:DNA polymerase epsilon subunit 1
VFRADIPAKFTLVPSALQQLIDNIDRDLTFTLEVEHGMQRSDAVNYDEVRQVRQRLYCALLLRKCHL